MTGAGRPLRFLLGVTGGWALLRVAMLWSPATTLPQVIEAANPVELASARVRPVIAKAVTAAPQYRAVDVSAPSVAVLPAPYLPVPSATQPLEAVYSRDLGPELPPHLALIPSPPAPAVQTPFHVPRPPGTSRWSGSAWLFLRPGAAASGAAPVPQLGGSQVGIRIDRAIGRGIALTARANAPLNARGAEAAIGVAWQPRAVPIRVVAEQRFGFDGARGGAALGVSGGVSDVALAAGFRLEGYGQAGVIARGGGEGYADGAVRAARPLAHIAGASIDLGAGAWGAAQRDAARLDIGPTAALRLPMAGGGARLSIDWRERVAGRARPAGGLTITLGADF